MKRIAYVIFAAILLFAATLKTSAQSGETREVSGFNGIASAGPFSVHVKIDGTESLKINASDNISNEIETKVEDGTLEIKMKHHGEWNHIHMGRIDIYVTAKSLSSLANAGSGSINVDGALVAGKVSIKLSGSGDITSSVKAGELHAAISGSGAIHLSGNTDNANVEVTGSGRVMGKDLKTGSASIAIAGSGNVYLSADKNISAHIAGSGNVIYTGNASLSDSRTTGSGRVRKAY